MLAVTWITVGGWALWALYALVALRWVWGNLELSRITRTQLLRPSDAAPASAAAARISVIIAAHNEQAGIEACLSRVLAQTHQPAQVIVANDRSTDATGEIVRRIAADHANVECIDVAELPPGWLGKTHAIAIGARHATGDWLAFSDADVVWHPALLATALDLTHRDKLDFLSLWPRTIVIGFWERLLLPACGWILSLWFNPRRVSDTAKSNLGRLQFANGQFLMVRRAAYEKIGGHAAVPSDVAEDVALAYRVHEAGLRQHVGLGRDLLATRMYENRRQIIDGWTRIFIGALRTPGRLVVSLMAIAIGVWSAFVVCAGLGIHAAQTGGWHWPALLWLFAAMIHIVAMYAALYRHLALGTAGRAHVLLLPLALVGVAAILMRALLVMNGIGTMRWGGVQYKLRGPQARASASSVE